MYIILDKYGLVFVIKVYHNKKFILEVRIVKFGFKSADYNLITGKTNVLFITLHIKTIYFIVYITFNIYTIYVIQHYH